MHNTAIKFARIAKSQTIDPNFKSDYDAFITSIYLIKRDAFKEHLVNNKNQSKAILRIAAVAAILLLALALIYFILQGNSKKNEVDTDELGEQVRGEGIIGLTRGFFLQGFRVLQ